MVMLHVSPLFRVVLRLAGFRIIFEVSLPPSDGDDPQREDVEEISGTLLGLGGVSSGAQELRSPASPTVQQIHQSRSPAAVPGQETSWPERLQRAGDAGKSAAEFLKGDAQTWQPASPPMGQWGALANRTWVVVRGMKGCPQDCSNGVVCAKSGPGVGGMAELIGECPCPTAVYQGFPSSREVSAYLQQFRSIMRGV